MFEVTRQAIRLMKLQEFHLMSTAHLDRFRSLFGFSIYSKIVVSFSEDYSAYADIWFMDEEYYIYFFKITLGKPATLNRCSQNEIY